MAWPYDRLTSTNLAQISQHCKRLSSLLCLSPKGRMAAAPASLVLLLLCFYLTAGNKKPNGSFIIPTEFLWETHFHISILCFWHSFLQKFFVKHGKWSRRGSGEWRRDSRPHCWSSTAKGTCLLFLAFSLFKLLLSFFYPGLSSSTIHSFVWSILGLFLVYAVKIMNFIPRLSPVFGFHSSLLGFIQIEEVKNFLRLPVFLTFSESEGFRIGASLELYNITCISFVGVSSYLS